MKISRSHLALARFRILKCISVDHRTPYPGLPRFTEIARRTPESSVSDLSFFVIKVVRQSTPVKKKIKFSSLIRKFRIELLQSHI